LPFLKGLIDGALTRLIVLASEYRGQSGFEVIDQLVHRIVKTARAARREFDGNWLFRIDKIVDIDPVQRTGLCHCLCGQHGLDGILHAGALGTDYEQVESGLVHLRSKPDRFDRAALTDQPVDQLQLCRR
jgi:hypothetical protein